jgi:DNA-binding MarR family transcriptional regulator
MDGYVLQKHEDGKFVSMPGSHHSYTSDLTKAQVFATEEEAKRDKCGNESAVRVSSLLNSPGLSLDQAKQTIAQAEKTQQPPTPATLTLADVLLMHLAAVGPCDLWQLQDAAAKQWDDIRAATISLVVATVRSMADNGLIDDSETPEDRDTTATVWGLTPAGDEAFAALAEAREATPTPTEAGSSK